MRKWFVALLLLIGAAIWVLPAFAQEKLINARIAQELKSRAARLGGSANDPGLNDTTYVGYNPAYAGSNYWSIGVGKRFPAGAFGRTKADIPPITSDRTGYWDWDHPVHGDSLQGWWPMAFIYSRYFSTITDDARPWFCIDIGNQLSYVINQGDATNPGHPGVNLRRTFGVTSAWHQDPGSGAPTVDPSDANKNPKSPNWTPIGGSGSAWCGLRGSGDITRVDPITGNPYNSDCQIGDSQWMLDIPTGPGFTGTKYPGYGDQWDQLLYRDVDISGATAGSNVSLTFSYRTRMSTLKNTADINRCGWFDKDPLALNAGNFISASVDADKAPIDSFMVYVGCPVADTVGAVWTGSDGDTHPVFDPVRRWFGELIRANEGPSGGVEKYYEMHTTYGNDPALPGDNGITTVTVTRPVTYGQLRTNWGNIIRVVFRIKTNRGFCSASGEIGSSDETGSLTVGSYDSNKLGAAEVDNVSINLPAVTSIGTFETQSSINNSSGVSAKDAWKTSSKPPGYYHHVHELSDLTYNDLCGDAGSVNRICDLAGNVISMGDHDHGEAFNGPNGTAYQDLYQGILSPTINLCYDHTPKAGGNCPGGKNNMGLDCDTAVPTGQYAIITSEYLGGFNFSQHGSLIQFEAQCYPALQADGTGVNNLTGGTRCWNTLRNTKFGEFNPDPQCFDEFFPLGENDLVRTTNANGVPDSIRIGLRKKGECWRVNAPLCGTTLGGYWDNTSLVILDGAQQTLSVDIWDLLQDAFPANENNALVTAGGVAFDTTAAYVKGALNIADQTNDPTRYEVPEDTMTVHATGDSVELQLKFRIWPGPGNYVVLGNTCSGLRQVPYDSTRIKTTDGGLTDRQRRFWTSYILNPGKSKTGFPTTGPCKGGGTLRHDQRWNELVWCNARMDTAELNLYPVEAANIGLPQVGIYSSTYHELDPRITGAGGTVTLGITKNRCFLIDPTGANDYTNTVCDGTVPAPYGGAAGTTTEYTKILPDGIFTPGTHIQYFFFKKDLKTGITSMAPDTNAVYPQYAEGPSFDGHRWQEWSCLPDNWKKPQYGGLNPACLLYVDWNDRRGDEQVWKGVADSIGATDASRKGANDGYVWASKKDDLNDPANFVHGKNCQAGTTWDMYGVKAAESINNGTGSIGSRISQDGPGTDLLVGRRARNAPTLQMMKSFYRVMMILSGDLNSNILGPFDNRSSDDTQLILLWCQSGTLNAHRGLFCGGNGFMEDITLNAGNSTMEQILGATLREPSYLIFSANSRPCIDLLPQAPITAKKDIFGIRNNCLQTADVLLPQGDGVAASLYDAVGANPVNAPYVASVFRHAEAGVGGADHWQALVDGWDTWWMRSRMCDKTIGRLLYYWDVYTNIFGKICVIVGTAQQTVEVPNNSDGSAFVDFAGVNNNVLRQGSAIINLSLAKADRVTVKIYDVSGRLVRTLADGQMFKAGNFDKALTWDGLDNNGRQVSRGAYFVSIRYQNSRFDTAKKMIVLK